MYVYAIHARHTPGILSLVEDKTEADTCPGDASCTYLSTIRQPQLEAPSDRRSQVGSQAFGRLLNAAFVLQELHRCPLIACVL